jgi:hypothetical protein
MKRSALRAADGATFHGGFTAHDEDGVVGAWCYAQLITGDTIRSESSEFMTCSSEVEALNWIHQQACYRQFDHWYRH